MHDTFPLCLARLRFDSSSFPRFSARTSEAHNQPISQSANQPINQYVKHKQMSESPVPIHTDPNELFKNEEAPRTLADRFRHPFSVPCFRKSLLAGIASSIGGNLSYLLWNRGTHVFPLNFLFLLC
jgi:hypothetical protein